LSITVGSIIKHMSPASIESAQVHSAAAQRRSRQRRKDSLLELPDLDQAIHITVDEDRQKEHHGMQSWASQLVLTPVLMVSFLFSLCYVDHRQRAWRTAQQDPLIHSSVWSRISAWTWLDPEPYQSPDNTSWGYRQDSTPGVSVPQPAWITRKKHRKMARLEVTDAFQMRGRVMFFTAVWLCLGIACASWMIRKLYGWVL